MKQVKIAKNCDTILLWNVVCLLESVNKTATVSGLKDYNSYKFIPNPQDAEEVLRICNIYDWDGKGEIDMFYFMDIFYAMGMNLTKKTCVKFGQTDDVDKKFMKFDEVVKLVQAAVKEPEHTGNYHDYVELCKLYDKNENGTMMLAELETFLTLMGKLKSNWYLFLKDFFWWPFHSQFLLILVVCTFTFFPFVI